jgi:hypothetical protein
LLNSYRAGAHCNLITLEVSALYSVAEIITIGDVFKIAVQYSPILHILKGPNLPSKIDFYGRKQS